MPRSYPELSVGDSLPIEAGKPRPRIALAERRPSFREACRRPLSTLALSLTAAALALPFIAAPALSALTPPRPEEAGLAFPILRPWLYSLIPALLILGLGLTLSHKRRGFGKERLLGLAYVLVGLIAGALVLGYDPAPWSM